ncbi:hypothetical protein [Candidatus Enterococcus courvalinii]|uniref:DUF998 domain-containing protein n=1 Tax=Candidatus Enterococcus courvalinii TaxID=2815329 RepID=A0ABS3I016_9ENTE|nr:hypothetical protein [Enterococcus sp. MSG2901]MBO0482057.1 hypothetical protein [Enterococcus sp. MSG2901]
MYRKTMIYLQLASLFGLLAILFFVLHTFSTTSDAPNHALGWLLLDYSTLNTLDQSAGLLILSSLSSLLFAIFFSRYVYLEKTKELAEASFIFIALKLFSFLAVLLYTFNQNSLFFFILNGLVVTLVIFSFFFFSLVFKELKLNPFFCWVSLICFGYNFFAFLFLAFAPTIQTTIIQDVSNCFDFLFVICLAFLMWQYQRNKTYK